jgi:protocatechuate 3,4-dioxygenase beta subunit
MTNRSDIVAEVDAHLAHVVTGLTKALGQELETLGVRDFELQAALQFLTEVGRADEFMLLSDVLGISVLVDRLTHGVDEAVTATNVTGPFYRPDSPLLSPPHVLPGAEEGEALFVSGTVSDARTGAPIPSAMLDVWQANAEGLYDQQIGDGTEVRFRGRLAADDDGRYEFRTVVPPPYEIPKDGPVGRLLRSLGRHAFRPAHIHIKAAAEGFAPLTTMVFMAGDEYLGSDAIDAVKDALVVGLERVEAPRRIQSRGETGPYWTCRFDVRLRPALDSSSA